MSDCQPYGLYMVGFIKRKYIPWKSVAFLRKKLNWRLTMGVSSMNEAKRNECQNDHVVCVSVH